MDRSVKEILDRATIEQHKLAADAIQSGDVFDSKRVLAGVKKALREVVCIYGKPVDLESDVELRFDSTAVNPRLVYGGKTPAGKQFLAWLAGQAK